MVTPLHEHKLSFFRQSGWMMITTVGSGVLMSLVHVLSKSQSLPTAEYSAVVTLLQVVNWLAIPAIGLQATIAQQASSVMNELDRERLAATVRQVLRGTFLIWLIIALVSLVFQGQLTSAFKLSNPMSLWLTLGMGLVMLWLPVFQGLLQGRQNFMWLGWAMVFNGAGRLLLATLIVLAFHGGTAGVMMAALLGAAAALLVTLWHSRSVFREQASGFATLHLLRRLVPLSLGCGVSQFLFSADMVVVQSRFENTGAYGFGGTLARAIVIFTAPLVAVMFPKIVHSMVSKRQTNVVGLTLLLTAVLGCGAALGISIFSPLVIRFASKPEYTSIAPLMPLFAFAMVPLALGNVLLSTLMARSQYRCVPVLLVIAVAYWVALQLFGSTFQRVIFLLGSFNTLFLAVLVLFVWWPRTTGVTQSRSAITGE